MKNLLQNAVVQFLFRVNIRKEMERLRFGRCFLRFYFISILTWSPNSGSHVSIYMSEIDRYVTLDSKIMINAYVRTLSEKS